VTTENNIEAIFFLDKDDRHLNHQMEAVEQHIIQSIRRSDDIILVSSLNRGARSKSVENILKNYKKEIRTFTLGSEFFKNDEGNDSASIADLIDMTDVILGSTHSENFFVVLLEDADNLHGSDIEELCRVIETLNKENNHLAILMVCDPVFVNTIKNVSGVSNLKLSDCSLDKISQDDIQNFIEERQQKIESANKLVFDASALKIITTHATGSLYEASILLEWCRVYAHHKNTLQLDSALINQMFSTLLSASPNTGTNLLRDYPPNDFSFEENSLGEQIKPSLVGSDDDNPDAVDDSAIIKASAGENNIEPDFPEKQEIPTLKSASITNEANYKPLLDNYSDAADPAMEEDLNNKDKSDKPKSNALGWVAIVVILAFGLYYFNYIYKQTKAPADSNPHSATSDLTVTPEKNTAQEKFEEIVIPKEDTVISANEQDDPPPGEENENVHAEDNTAAITEEKQSSLSTLVEPPIIDEEFTDTTNEEPLPANNVVDSARVQSVASESPPPDSLLSATTADNSEEAIDVLLDIAGQQYNDKQLTTPDSGNAFNTYQLILQIDPENQQAIEGLAKIVDRYKEWIYTDIEDENYTRARTFLRRAFRVAPEDQELKSLEEVIARGS
jgi:hypothetical protein